MHILSTEKKGLSMKFRIWHVLFVLLVLGLVTGGIAYGQSPDPMRRGATTSMRQGGGEKFFKAGTTKYAAGFATNTVVSNGGTDLGPQVSFKVPAGMKADIIATFSGEVGNPGPSTGDACFGVLAITNDLRQMLPAGGIILFGQDVQYGGKMGSASIQQYLTNVPAGNHAVIFGMYAYNADNNDQCQVGYRTITVIANIHP